MLQRTAPITLAILAVAIVVGCRSNSGPTAPDADFFVLSGQSFLLRFGDTAGVQTQAGIAIVRFADVLNDSRCPVDVNCVTAGAATIALSVQTSLANRDVPIEVPPNGEAEVVVDELTIEVLRLRPDARAGTSIDLIDYEIGLNVRQSSDIALP